MPTLAQSILEQGTAYILARAMSLDQRAKIVFQGYLLNFRAATEMLFTPGASQPPQWLHHIPVVIHRSYEYG